MPVPHPSMQMQAAGKFRNKNTPTATYCHKPNCPIVAGS